MTEDELAEIEARAAAATPGPWETYEDRLYESFSRFGVMTTRQEFPICKAAGGLGAKNAEFIAHARTDIPALIAEIRRLKEELDDVKGWGEYYASHKEEL